MATPIYKAEKSYQQRQRTYPQSTSSVKNHKPNKNNTEVRDGKNYPQNKQRLSVQDSIEKTTKEAYPQIVPKAGELLKLIEKPIECQGEK